MLVECCEADDGVVNKGEICFIWGNRTLQKSTYFSLGLNDVRRAMTSSETVVKLFFLSSIFCSFYCNDSRCVSTFINTSKARTI